MQWEGTKDSWDHYQRVVIFRLDTLAEKQEHIDLQLQDLRLALAKMDTYRKLVSAAIGFIAGLIPVAVSLAYEFLSR